MRTYFLLLVFAASAVAIVECDAGGDPNQVRAGIGRRCIEGTRHGPTQNAGADIT